MVSPNTVAACSQETPVAKFGQGEVKSAPQASLQTTTKRAGDPNMAMVNALKGVAPIPAAN